MKTPVKITLGVAGFLLLLGVAGLMFNYQTGNNVKNEEIPAESLTILNYQLAQGGDGNRVITGIAENTAGKQLSYAEVRVKFYDTKGELIGNSFDNVNGLSSGEKWNFEVMYLGPDNDKVNGYEVVVGSAW